MDVADENVYGIRYTSRGALTSLYRTNLIKSFRTVCFLFESELKNLKNISLGKVNKYNDNQYRWNNKLNQFDTDYANILYTKLD